MERMAVETRSKNGWVSNVFVVIFCSMTTSTWSWQPPTFRLGNDGGWMLDGGVMTYDRDEF
jgi:hypothetical protein